MTKTTKRALLVESARARAVWPDIMATVEFKLALWLFGMCIVGLAVLGLTSKFAPGRIGVSEHPLPVYVIQKDIASP